MIEYRTGNILEAEDIEALVNPVNCKGVMGAGLALQFKEKFPYNFKQYEGACKRGELKQGVLCVVGEPPFWIINWPTKVHWKDESDYQFIYKGFKDLNRYIFNIGIESIAFPALGCGLGGLKWDRVRKIIVKRMRVHPKVKTVIYEPQEN